VKAYHKALYDFFKDYVSTNPDAGSLLRISQFIKDHKNVMVKDLSLSLDLLKPPLLDGKESELLDDYLKLIVRKMDEWTGNLMKTELEEFVKREKPPEEDADGLSGMQGAVIMFQSKPYPLSPRAYPPSEVVGHRPS
jgi:exocyst complex component 3